MNAQAPITRKLDDDELILLFEDEARAEWKKNAELKYSGYDMCDLTDKFGESEQFEALLKSWSAGVDSISAQRALKEAVKNEIESAFIHEAQTKFERLRYLGEI